MPRELHFNWKQNTKSINILKITNNVKKLLGKLTISNKSLVLSISLTNYTVKIAN